MSGTIPDFSPAANSGPVTPPPTDEKIPDFSPQANAPDAGGGSMLDTVAHGAGQLAVGANQGIASMVGAPVDLLTGAANMLGRGANAVFGTDIQPIVNPVGGSESIKRAMGYLGADPDKMPAKSTADQVLQAIGSNVAGMAVPALGAEAAIARGVGAASPVTTAVLQSIRGGGAMPETGAQTAARVAGVGALGVPAGVGQVAGEKVAPPGYEGLGGLAGAFLGAGLGAGAVAGARSGAQRFAGEPVADTAQQMFTGAMTDPHQTLADIAIGKPSALAGTAPTTANTTNDTGLLQLQNWARNQRPDLFSQRATADNAGHVNAVESVAPAAETVMPPAEALRTRLADVDQAYQSVQDAARAHADQTLGVAGGTEAPAVYGAQGQQAIAANYAPQIGAEGTPGRFVWRSADGDYPVEPLGDVQTAPDGQKYARVRSILDGKETFVPQAELVQTGGTAPSGVAGQLQNARQKLITGIQQLGGQPDLQADFDTLRQQYGSQLHGVVEQGRAARATQENALWAPIKRSNVQFDPTPTQDAVKTARGMINPTGGDVITPAEQQLYGVIDKWNGPQPVDNIKSMRTNIGSAADIAYRGGDRAAAARLREVRNGLDASMDAAISDRVAQDQAAVAAGRMQPDQTFEADLLRSQQDWLASKSGQRPGSAMAGAGSGVADNGNVGPAAVPGPSGTTGAAAEGRTAAASVPDVAGTEAPDVAGQYARARAFTRETHRIFDDTPAGAALERGPYGQPHDNPNSVIAGNFWNAKNTAPEAIRNFEEATGGNAQAKALLQDYATHDLLAKSLDPKTGEVNLKAYDKWIASHKAALDTYPELRAKFGTVRAAQEQVAGLAAQRAALEDAFTKAMGGTPETNMARYFQRGPRGEQAMANYLKETNASPEGIDAMTNHMAADLRAKAAKTGDMNTAVYRNWIADNRPALTKLDDAAPGTLAKFDTIAHAQETLADAAATRQQAVKDFETGAARFWLNSDPITAVTNALSKRAGNDPVANMDQVMTLVRNDPAAQAGIKRAVVDWLLAKGAGGKEAGNTGTNYLRIQKMQDLIRDNRAALSRVLTPQDMRTLDQVAESLRVSDRGISGSKAPIGPGTARDVMAAGKMNGKPPTVMNMAMSGLIRLGAFGAGHLAGGLSGGVAGLALKDAGADVMGSLRNARMQQAHDLVIDAVLNPEIARTLTTRVTPNTFDSVTQRLQRQLAIVAATQGARYLEKEKH